MRRIGAPPLSPRWRRRGHDRNPLPIGPTGAFVVLKRVAAIPYRMRTADFDQLMHFQNGALLPRQLEENPMRTLKINELSFVSGGRGGGGAGGDRGQGNSSSASAGAGNGNPGTSTSAKNSNPSNRNTAGL